MAEDELSTSVSSQPATSSQAGKTSVHSKVVWNLVPSEKKKTSYSESLGWSEWGVAIGYIAFSIFVRMYVIASESSFQSEIFVAPCFIVRVAQSRACTMQENTSGTKQLFLFPNFGVHVLDF